MTNAPLVTRKLAVLDDHVQRLRERRPETLEAFSGRSGPRPAKPPTRP